LASAHARTVRDESPLALRATDAGAVQRWLEGQLSFRPILPRAAWGGFLLLGARTLSLPDGAAALMLFGRGDRRVSLVSLPGPAELPSGGRSVDADGVRFRIFIHGRYTLVLWMEQGLLHAMISDEEPDETLEYARLCAQQMRSPA
jgi:anti-sigma factor RsiW